MWLAVIQAAGLLLGVVLGLAIGMGQARTAWKNQLDARRVEHENQLVALKVEHENQLAALKFTEEHKRMSSRTGCCGTSGSRSIGDFSRRATRRLS